MDLWFSETHETDLRMSVRIKQVLYHRKSQYQDVLVLDTLRFGRMLVLDGCVMTTERDEFVYHELISHPALLTVNNPQSVCVVGGGDGGTVREVLKHPTVERVVLAEIDQDVIDVCKEFFPGHTSGLTDPRVDIQVGDGFEYLKQHPGEFDVILSDSTDPIGPGVVLFSSKYFDLAKSAMKQGGCFVTQAEGMWCRSHSAVSVRNELLNHFKSCEWYGAPIPTYPGGFWSFLIASDAVDFRKIADKSRQKLIEQSSKFYSSALHSGLFSMPRFMLLEYENNISH